MANLNLTIDDCTNARFALPAAILFALVGALVVGIEWAQIPFIWEAQAMIGVMLLAALLLLFSGAAITRRNRICAEADRPTGYQGRRRRRRTGRSRF